MIGIPADPPAGLSSAPHRRTGAPVKQRAIVARTLQKSQSKAKQSRAKAKQNNSNG
ncbi:hypothetical protein GCM10008098_08040 [Rhodanobacter panaciterrae]|uniref:Uncharacterized protein n=1 Tax=Rhodanobacter panaciterrae TaxID=490572 RepID=A0ABQ2ZKJ2_9GAMM|nr:hypothetical protein GCM10008098_08040 [Rhodanobacter panaciterrae]